MLWSALPYLTICMIQNGGHIRAAFQQLCSHSQDDTRGAPSQHSKSHSSYQSALFPRDELFLHMREVHDFRVVLAISMYLTIFVCHRAAVRQRALAV